MLATLTIIIMNKRLALFYNYNIVEKYMTVK